MRFAVATWSASLTSRYRPNFVPLARKVSRFGAVLIFDQLAF
jgi:hypothetical protein